MKKWLTDIQQSLFSNVKGRQDVYARAYRDGVKETLHLVSNSTYLENIESLAASVMKPKDGGNS